MALSYALQIHSYMMTEAFRHTPHAPSLAIRQFGTSIPMLLCITQFLFLCCCLVYSITFCSPHLSLWNWGELKLPPLLSYSVLLIVTPIVMGKFVVVNTGLYCSPSSLRDVSMVWKVCPKCREL